jgi:transmembrane protease serine 3
MQHPGHMPDLKGYFRIIGGVPAKEHSWPWLVMLEINHPPPYFVLGCGGLLLRVSKDIEASDIVLTAAHCLTR